MANSSKAKAKHVHSAAKGNIEALYVKLNSVVDLARHMTTSGTMKHVSAIRKGSMYKLFSIGEKVGGVQIVYYVNTEKLGKFIIYTISAQSEYIEMRDTIAASISDYNVMKAPILELETELFKDVKGSKGELTLIKAKDFDSFVKSLVNDSQYGGSSAKAYAFFYKGAHYTGSFELVRDTGKVFTYSELNDGAVFNYLKYNYSTDAVERANVMADKAYTYVRVINLAEPFPFFKA